MTTAGPRAIASSPATRLVGQLRFDAGNLTLDLIATLGRRFGTPVERLTGPDRLEAWVHGTGLRVDLSGHNQDDVDRLRRFREQANEVVRAAFAGVPPSDDALAALSSACAIPLTLTKGADGDGVRLGAGSVSDAIIGLVGRDAVLLLSGPGRKLIAECAAADCRMLYARPNGSRRTWCSSAHCGNRHRVAANYARTKTALPTGPESTA